MADHIYIQPQHIYDNTSRAERHLFLDFCRPSGTPQAKSTGKCYIIIIKVLIVLQEEAPVLQAKYGSMEPGERAFSILLDLGMIIAHPDPDSLSYDHNFDNGIVPSGEWI